MATREPRRPSSGGRPSRQPNTTHRQPSERRGERPTNNRPTSRENRPPRPEGQTHRPTQNQKKPVQKRPSQRKRRPTINEVTYTPNTWLRILSLILVVVVFVAGIAIFFRVASVQVTGNQLYTQEEIQNASGITTGDNLLILSKGDVAGNIMALLPYVEEVRIGKELPNLVTIDVVESNATYLVSGDDGGRWLINSEGKLLEKVDGLSGTYPTISGLTAIAPEPGVELETENPDTKAAALAVIGELESTDYLAKIVEINVEKPYEIHMYYQDIYQIELGGYDQMAYKIQYLTTVLGQLRETETGIIDLTLGEEKVARFRPW